jgi:hypothetical protein
MSSTQTLTHTCSFFKTKKFSAVMYLPTRTLNLLLSSLSLFLSFRALDVTHPYNRLKTMYCKFMPKKTQSLDIDESTIANNYPTQNCFESINEEKMTDASCGETSDRQKKSATSGGCQARPIFPNLSYSPLSSPRILRKPAKESRRISIDKNGSFMQLNQYRLMDQIGVVSRLIVYKDFDV